MSPIAEYSAMSPEEFEDSVSKIVSSLGYELDSIKVDGDDRISITATPATEKLKEKTLFWFIRNKKVGAPPLKKLTKLMDDQSFSSAVVASTLGFTENARHVAEDKSITLFDGFHTLTEVPAPKDETRPRGDVHNIYDTVFTLGVSADAAREYFETKKEKKLFGLLPSREEVTEVTGRYAPIGVFRLSRIKGMAPNLLSGVSKNMEESNTIYVNLTTGMIYYIGKNIFKKRYELDEVDLIARIIDTPLEDIRVLADVHELGEASMDDLMRINPHLADGGGLPLMSLRTRGVVDYVGDARPRFLLSCYLPSFSDLRYRLDEYIGFEEGIDSTFTPDPISYRPEQVLTILKLFNKADGVFNGVVYLPYYVGRFADRRGGFRHLTLPAPEYTKKP